ncbi:hypothetical protein [Pseudomonas sp. W2Aug9]|uniref:hypothetical protein n=1 Tax=Pseudomonas sp. W2Aug9 TaxID=1215242 RepID=UPI002002F859|nr:hypothetical protein [Pseudomonas sp. W2Aug9]MCK3827252.1 hypothetical protein [Pseudomonas sp. W2Aug9]
MMRFTSTLAVAATLSLLSLGAQAAAPSNWPAGARDAFVSDCSAAASQNVDLQKAKAHCECGADKINAELTSAEITELMAGKPPVGDKAIAARSALETKAVAAIDSCRVVKKK